MFTNKDFKQIAEKGISLTTIEKQIQDFKQGFPFVNLSATATIRNGIIKFDEQELASLLSFYERKMKDYKIMKFVPASGAASRMFKSLFSFLQDENSNIYNPENVELLIFIDKIKDFAFYHELKQAMLDDGYELESCLQNKEYQRIIEYLITEKGLNYGQLPKGLLRFHHYKKANRLSIEEHFVESAEYCLSHDRKVALHFTVSPEHLSKFKETVDRLLPKYEVKYNCKFEINFSIQKPSTDTIAVDLDNNPFRNNDGSLLFRPGGHGALIENLNDLDADIIFIKNIDNIQRDNKKADTIIYKKALCAHLIKIVEWQKKALQKIDEDNLSEDDLNEIEKKSKENISLFLSETYYNLNREDKIIFWKKALNKPIRICGMVVNEGEPGGGPFWVADNKNKSLQIVESAQINFSDERQKKIFRKSTHFNPVDLVCHIKNYKGYKFDLKQFVDYKTGFISPKSKDGKDIKALELPGLWNGAMAKWITVFVEVPITTFSPVKTVNDLLKEVHQ